MRCHAIMLVCYCVRIGIKLTVLNPNYRMHSSSTKNSSETNVINSVELIKLYIRVSPCNKIFTINVMRLPNSSLNIYEVFLYNSPNFGAKRATYRCSNHSLLNIHEAFLPYYSKQTPACEHNAV